jgi:uncharacterized protein (TIGR00251 family)
MKILVRVRPNARKNEIIRLDETSFQVHVTAPPAEGRANEKVIELLAEFFRKPKRSITILRGRSSRDKIVEVL